MRKMTAGRPADADEIRSYADIVAAHRALSRKTASGTGDTTAYAHAAERVERLGRLYRRPNVLTDEMRTTAETALAAIRQAARPTGHQDPDRFVVADTWLDHLDLLVAHPDDGR